MAGVAGELVVVSGRYRGHRIPLAREAVRIGRDRACEIAIDDEAASRVHSEIVRKDGRFLLRDLNSTNGTYLNDARITEAALQNGDRVSIGDTVLLLQLDIKPEAAPPQVVFSKDQQDVNARFSLSLTDTRFLQMKEGTSMPDVQRQFTALYEFMVDIAGVLHAPALVERALTHLFKAFQPDRALVLLLTPEGEPGFTATKVKDGCNKEQITISRTMAHHLLQKKESFLSLNASSDERLAGSQSLASMRVNSIMGSPLQVKDKVLGMIYLDTIAGGHLFSEQDLKLCTAMSVQLAVCLENSRLYTELLDAAEFNNSVLRALGSGIIVVDVSGRVLRVNRATQEILEKTESSLLGMPLESFPELAELNRVVRNTLTTCRPEDRHELLVKTPAQTIPLGLTTSVLSDHTGKVAGVVANFRNLAPVRKLEEQVRRSRHLSALGQMAAGVAHEIRNPLNSIRGFAQLLQERAGQDKPAAEYTQIILEEVDRMNGIVQDLLDFSRQRDLTLAPMQLEQMLEDLVRTLQSDAQKAQVRLKIVPCAEVVPGVLGSSDKLRQVFRNIIQNALQACKPGGQVTAGFTILAHAPGEQEQNAASSLARRELAVAVEDTGCGIDPAVMPKIFDPFFTQKDSGTGLGLSISQKIVEQHGGRIEVKSEPGKGSVFTVVLPAI